MTKIVVVVDETHKEIFEGENLEACTGLDVNIGMTTPMDCVLRIYEIVNGEKDNEIAAFKHWTYWRYTN